MIDLSTIPLADMPSLGTLSPEALGLLPQGGSVADALKVLKKKQFAHESIPVLADAMPEREAVWWAAESCERVGPKLAPADLNAAKAAAAWAKGPSPESAAAAATAAKDAGFNGPGAFAAQAASFAEDPPMLAAGDALGSSLANRTAGGSVRLASLVEAEALPALVPPEAVAVTAAGAAAAGGAVAIAQTNGSSDDDDPQQQADTAEPVSKKERKKASKASEPFVKLGQDVASGLNHW